MNQDCFSYPFTMVDFTQYVNSSFWGYFKTTWCSYPFSSPWEFSFSPGSTFSKQALQDVLGDLPSFLLAEASLQLAENDEIFSTLEIWMSSKLFSKILWTEEHRQIVGAFISWWFNTTPHTTPHPPLFFFRFLMPLRKCWRSRRWVEWETISPASS